MTPEVQRWLVLALAGGGVVAALRYPPDVAFAGVAAALLVTGILTPAEALAGMANEGVATVAVLFVVAAALRETGALAGVAQRILGRPRSTAHAQLRLMLPVAAMSAFLNNTPIVAMMLPLVTDWAKKHRLSVSKLLIPLSYATILGGACTLIGTSTNLVVQGLLRQARPDLALGLFELAWVGVPCAAVGLAYVLVASRWLLPERRPAASLFADPREYTVEMLIQPNSPLVGRTIEEAGLRHLPGLYLMEIDREGEVRPAVASSERLRARDRLVFAGVVTSVIDLQRMPGLVPAADAAFSLEGDRVQRLLVEAVVADACPMVGRTIREGRFRSVYGAAVIAVARHGRRLGQRIGDIVLQAGDTLLLEAHPWFVDHHRNRRDFFLVSQVAGWSPPRWERAWIALLVLAGLVIAAGTGMLGLLEAAMVAAGLLLLTRCIGVAAAREAVDWPVLLVIAASFAVSRAIETTGTARWVASGLVGLGGGPRTTLALFYGATMLFNALLTNNATAALMFPIATATADSLSVSLLPFAVALMMAGSNDFATPIGYQTNLMVYGPGGYRFADYVRLGGPLNLLLWAVAVLVIPLVWRF